MPPKSSDFRLGDYLLHNKLLSKEQLEYALKYQHTARIMLGMVLTDLGLIEEEVLLDQLMNLLPDEYLPELGDVEEKQFGELESMVEPRVISLVPSTFCRKNKVMPIKVDPQTKQLTVAMLDPSDDNTIQELHFITNMRIEPIKAQLSDLQQLWLNFFSRVLDTESDERKLVHKVGLQAMVPRVTKDTIPQFVDAILKQGVTTRSTDIHLDPFNDKVLVRYRIDGTLYPVCEMPPKIYKQLVSRIKIMAQLDISEKRNAQDGRIDIEVAKSGKKQVDMRVAIVPTYFGERVTFRILDQDPKKMHIGNLGLSDRDNEIFLRYLSMQQGLILITGPTSSGKTTTIYSMLNTINDLSRNIMTIEDPVEYLIDGFGQIQIDERTHVSFSNVLKFLLRQNPDVILVGEIRDPETAELAVRAALTGHLIISTVHTNDTATAVSRMIDLGVRPYLLGPALQLVVAQRLAKRLCPACAKPTNVPPREMLRAGLRPDDFDKASFYESEGCNSCVYTGVKGVTGVFEVMPISKPLREKIMKNASSTLLRSLALREGMVSLKQAALLKAMRGEVSIYETSRLAFQL